MANRAYLYSSEDSEHWDFNSLEECPYYDSRHTFPLLWWFFFEEGDVFFKDISYHNSTWKEARLRADKLTGIARFKKFTKKWNDRFSGLISKDDIRLFLKTIKNWEGKYLFVDPAEIFEGNGKQDLNKVVQFLRDLTDLEKAPYSNIDTLEENPEVALIGYTYGN